MLSSFADFIYLAPRSELSGPLEHGQISFVVKVFQGEESADVKCSGGVSNYYYPAASFLPFSARRKITCSMGIW